MSEDNEMFDEDTHHQRDKFEQLEKFYHAFSFKTIIFDPLDRDIMYEEEVETEDGETEEKISNQATKRDDFLQKIEACNSILGVSTI